MPPQHCAPNGVVLPLGGAWILSRASRAGRTMIGECSLQSEEAKKKYGESQESNVMVDEAISRCYPDS